MINRDSPTAASERVDAVAAPSGGEPPAGPTLEELFSIYSTVMQFGDLNLDDDFFELGGSSVLAIQIKARIDQMYGTDIQLDTFFEAGSVREMAKLLEQQLADAKRRAGAAV